MYQIANLLLQLRKQKGWTQAFAAREIGIQQSYLSKLENGKFLPSQEVYEKIAVAYDVEISILQETHTPEMLSNTRTLKALATQHLGWCLCILR